MARRCLWVSSAASLLVIATGLAVLVGWSIDYRPLMTVLPGLVSMKSNTAAAFCLAGASLFFLALAQARPNRRWQNLSTVFAAAAILIGALTLVEYLTGWNLGLDELLFRDPATSASAYYPPGRPAPITAFNFVSIGLALILIRFPKRIRWAQLLTGCTAFTALLALIGYFYGVDSLYHSGRFTAVAMHTAVAFLVLCVGIWCATSSFGFMQVITGSGTSGVLLRRYGLVVLVLPFLLNWLQLQGEQLGWYGASFGDAIFVMATFAALGALLWIGASSMRTIEAKEEEVRESLRQVHLDLERRVLERTSELAESLSLLNGAFESTADGIVAVDLAGKVTSYNSRFTELWQFPAELLERRDAAEFRLHVASQIQDPELFLRLVSETEVVPQAGSSSVVETKDGRVLERWAFPQQIGNRCVGTVLNYRDITERRRVEAERLVLVEIARSVLIATNLDELLERCWRSIGKLIYAENCFVGLHNAETDLIHFEFWVDKFDSIPPPQPIANGFTRSSYVLRTGQPLLLTSELKAQLFDEGKVASSGSDSASWLGVPLRTPTRTIGVLAVQHYEKEGVYNQHDLEFLALGGDQIALAIERKQAEATLRESEEKFRQLADNVTDAFWIASPDLGIMHYVSPGYELIWGRSTVSLYSDPHQWMSTIIPEDRAQAAAAFDGLRANEPKASVEYRILRPDGTIRWVHDRGFQVRDAAGKVVRLTGIASDITEQKEASASLLESQQRLSLAKEAAHTGIWDWDVVTNELFWDTRMYELYGIRAEDFSGAYSAWQQGLHPDDRARAEAEIMAAVDGASGFHTEFRVLWPSGEVRDIEAHAVAHHAHDGSTIRMVGVNWDITERKRAEQAQARFAAVMETTTDFVGLADVEGHVLYINPAGRRMMGFDEQVDITTTMIVDYSADEDRDKMMQESIPTAMREGVWSGESIFKRRDGRRIPLSQVVIAHKTANGEVDFMATTARDISERKTAEAAMAEATRQLLESSRQAGMAEVATSVLHNVGNVLNSVNISCSVISDRVRKSPISGLSRTAELLQQHTHDLAAFFDTDPVGRKLPDFLGKLSTQLVDEQTAVVAELQLLTQNIEHIKDIVSVQQSHANNVGGVRETLPCEGLMEDALRINEGSLRRHEIAVLREYREAPPISLEKHKVLQILVNLVRNAKQALTDSGRPDKRLTVQIGRNNGNVSVSVNDNGIGIAPENLTRIFAHGFTTRKDGHGFGLHSGVLAAQEMGGGLTVHSDGLGTGATFTLKLPVAGIGNN